MSRQDLGDLDAMEVVKLHLPPSRRDTPRDLVVPALTFNLETTLCGEAYAYQYCKAFAGWTATYEKLHDFQPLVYLGALLSLDLFDTDAWVDAWPRRHWPHVSERQFYLSRVSDTRKAIVVDRYGHLHTLKDGESVEPIDWVVAPMKLEIKKSPNDYDTINPH